MAPSPLSKTSDATTMFRSAGRWNEIEDAIGLVPRLGKAAGIGAGGVEHFQLRIVVDVGQVDDRPDACFGIFGIDNFKGIVGRIGYVAALVGGDDKDAGHWASRRGEP